MAQAICTSMAINANKHGRIYAVKRKCDGQTSTCASLCLSNIRNQDSQTSKHSWSTLGAIHVYEGRPASSGSSTVTTTLGLKTMWNEGLVHEQACGPNYCCCLATW